MSAQVLPSPLSLCPPRPGVRPVSPPQLTASPAVHVSVLMVDRQAGDLPLQLPKRRLLRQVGAQQQTAQHVSVGEQRGREKKKSESSC